MIPGQLQQDTISQIQMFTNYAIPERQVVQSANMIELIIVNRTEEQAGMLAFFYI